MLTLVVAVAAVVSKGNFSSNGNVLNLAIVKLRRHRFNDGRVEARAVHVRMLDVGKVAERGAGSDRLRIRDAGDAGFRGQSRSRNGLRRWERGQGAVGQRFGQAARRVVNGVPNVPAAADRARALRRRRVELESVGHAGQGSQLLFGVFLGDGLILDAQLKRLVRIITRSFSLRLAYWIVHGRSDREALGILLWR